VKVVIVINVIAKMICVMRKNAHLKNVYQNVRNVRTFHALKQLQRTIAP